MNCALCALNSQIINFKRFDPQQLLGVTKGQLCRRGPCAVGTGVPGPGHHPADWTGCQWYRSVIQLHVCISASPFQGPPDPTRLQGRRSERRFEPGAAAPTSGGRFSGLGRGDSATRLTRGHRLRATHGEVKQNSAKSAAGKELETGKRKPRAA